MKKTKRILLALGCLLATALLTVGCAAGTQAPAEAPEPNPASESTTPPVTEAAQTETEPVAETEPAPQETEGVTLSKPVSTPSDLGFSSGYKKVTINDHAFYVSDDGIYMTFEGQDTLLYSGSFQRDNLCNLCTDGGLLYAVDQAGDVLQLDLTDGSVKKLFNAGPAAAVLGASEDVLYIGQKRESEWEGYDLYVYSLDGVQQEKLGENLEVYMKDGILTCQTYNDFVAMPDFLRAYDRDGKLMVEADEVIRYSVQNGTLYYLALPEGVTYQDCYFNENASETILWRADSSGKTELRTFDVDNSDVRMYEFGYFDDDVFCIDGHFYSLENGAEINGGN